MPAPSIERISRICEMLDHPELTYPSIHITGTNGKTTTAHMASGLACAHGLPTGMFVSPHVVSVTERISVCGRSIANDEFAEEYAHLLPYLDAGADSGQRVTYFEALTALGYLWFADKPVSLAVFEVGMGGTWDATNLIRGDVAMICPIGLDHTAILGTTIAEIAAEKAGVIKKGRTVVVRAQRPDALGVIRSRCDEMGATILLEGDAFVLESRASAVGGQSLSVRGTRGSYGDVFLPVFGEQAARNAAASIAACEELLARPLDDRLIQEALAAVRVPGRMEVAARHPLVLLDGAHNVDAMTALVATLRESFTWERLHAVVGMFGDKDVEAVCAILGPLVDAGYAGMAGSPRAAPAERVAAALTDAGGREVRTFGSIGEAADAAVADAGRDDLILVTGSFYTVADARPMFISG